MRSLTVSMTVAILALAAPGGAAQSWNVPRDFATIQEAMDSGDVLEGDTINVSPGRWAGALVHKGVRLVGRRRCIINDGPEPWPGSGLKAGFLFPGGGAGNYAVIRGFRFRKLAFPIFSRGADRVKVRKCILKKPVQGITNWGGCSWRIRYNRIRGVRALCGGGIGIFVGDYLAVPEGVRDNIVYRNKVKKRLRVPEDDCGGYLGAGIAIHADFRDGAAGAAEISSNQVTYNRVALVSTLPYIADVAGVMLHEEEDPHPDLYVIHGNTVRYNRLRRTARRVDLRPPGLSGVNTIQGYLRPSPPEFSPAFGGVPSLRPYR